MRLHLFPFDLIEKGEKIVIYGLGTLGKEYIEEALSLKWCDIRYIVDKKAEFSEFHSIPVKLPTEIVDKEKYVFLIAVYNEDEGREIADFLVDKGVEKKRIIWRDVVCDIQGCESDMLETMQIRLDGIEKIQMVFNQKDFYISGTPFYFQKYGIDKYRNILKKFCSTNTVDNTLDQTRVSFLIENMENIFPKIEGDVAELGVYQGATAEIFLDYCKRYDRRLFLFDTYEGFSEKDIIGIDINQDSSQFEDTNERVVSERLGFDEHIRIKKGYFPESIDEETDNCKYAFVHIDCDLYQPIYSGISFFWPRLSLGGMMVIHDYASGLWDGATKAVNQFCNEMGVNKVIIPDWSGSVVLMKT